MADSPRDRFVVDAHIHFDPDEAEHVVEIMEANSISKVVRLGALRVHDIPGVSCLKLHSWRAD